MNFQDKIEEMEYHIKEHNSEFVIIEKNRNISDIIIIFGSKDKVISGYLKPNNILQSLDDVSHQYTVFREMQKDLKELSTLSNYEII